MKCYLTWKKDVIAEDLSMGYGTLKRTREQWWELYGMYRKHEVTSELDELEEPPNAT